MAINLSDNILAKTTAPGDAKYGPYTGADLAAAKSAATTYLQSSFRYEGLTVGLIIGSNPIVEYWFQGGVTDSDLVLKSQGGGDVAVKSDGVSVQTAADEFDFVSGIKATAVSGTDGVTIDTVFNTSIADDVESIALGGITSPTKASVLKQKTMVELMNELLFPTQLPTYTLPTSTISVSGMAASQEIGSEVNIISTGTGVKNDCGSITDVEIQANLNGAGYAKLTSGAGTATKPADVPNQFFTNPNNPNAGATLSFTQSKYTVPAPASGTSSIFYWRTRSTFTDGDAKQNNKDQQDTRPLGTSVNNPQLGRVITSSAITKRGYWPYYWGKSATQKSAAEVATLIGNGTYTDKQVKSAAGTLNMDFAAAGEWVWFAIPEGFNTKTEWYVSASNFGDIGASPTDLFAGGSVHSIVSEDGYWTKNFKIYVAQKVTTIGAAQIRE